MNKLLTTMFGLAVACVTVSVQAQKITGSIEAGAKKTAMCVGCHGIIGYQASFPEIHKVPKIAGQYADYLQVALKSYKTQSHMQLGRSNAVMGGQAKKYSNPELKELAAYIASLPGELKTVPESRFHSAD